VTVRIVSRRTRARFDATAQTTLSFPNIQGQQSITLEHICAVERVHWAMGSWFHVNPL